MKKSILLFVFLFAALLQVSAQNCGNSQPRPIYGEQRPCPGEIREYCIDIEKVLNKPFEVVKWEVPRAFAGEGPVGWEIVDRFDNDLPGDSQGYIKGNMYCITVKVGKKPGTMKVTVTHPDCGTKIATLPVMPGKSFEVEVSGPTAPCVGEEYTYTSSISVNENGQNTPVFTYKWHYPAGWLVGSDTQSSVILKPTPGSEGDINDVWVEVDDVANTDDTNGNGLGPKGYCLSASSKLQVISKECNPCPPGESITANTPAGPSITFTYLGSSVSGANSTISFGFSSSQNIDNVIIQLNLSPDVTPTNFDNPLDDYTATFNPGTSEITYARISTGSNNLTVSFTLPTAGFFEVYGLKVTTISDAGASTTYIGKEGDIRVITDCRFEDLQTFAVELSSFHGRATASGVELTWTTASEENNDRFEVQRSTDGKDFKTIGTVKGAGNSSTALRYTYHDKNASKGTSYYRLNQVDTDGTASLSHVIALENNSATATAGMSIYPNPATGDNLTITLDGNNMNNKTYMITISDINGRKVFEQNMSASDNSEINLSIAKLKISKGLYMIKVQGDNLIQTRKLLINR